MKPIDKIRENMNTILLLSRGLDSRRYAQIASVIRSSRTLLDTLEKLSADSDIEKLLRLQLDEAIAKQEKAITELQKFKQAQQPKKRVRNKQQIDTDGEE